MPRAAVGIAAGVVVVLELAGCGGSKSLSLPCKPEPHGALCVKVFRDGLTVRDVIGCLASSDSSLSGRRWRLALASYPCDPGSRPVPSCRPTAIYPGPIRHGNPPLVRFCRVNTGTGTVTVTAPLSCHDTLAEELASFGDFAGFNPPKSFASRAWLCVSEEFVTGPPTTPPSRACAAIT